MILRRLFLLDTAHLLIQHGEIQAGSREEAILLRVAHDGATVLSHDDRAHFDQIIVPMLEWIRYAKRAPGTSSR